MHPVPDIIAFSSNELLNAAIAIPKMTGSVADLLGHILALEEFVSNTKESYRLTIVREIIGNHIAQVWTSNANVSHFD